MSDAAAGESAVVSEDLAEPPSRRPPALYRQGREPDPRFSMANERTALAWIRTALALVAGGIGLTSLTRLVGFSRGMDGIAAAMCLVGGWLAVSAVLGWRRRELALRTARPLPSPVALPWLAGAVAIGALALAVAVLTGWVRA
jgi:putative membrane protein